MAHPRLATRDLALILAVVALWGFSFVAIKVGLREIPPFALASLRFFFAAVPLVFFVRRPRMPWRFVAGYGLGIGVFQFGLLFLGMKLGMPAGLSSVVIQLQIFFTVGLAVAFLGDELRREDLLGAAVATLGVALLGVYKIMEGVTSTLIGLLLVIAAALAWGVGNVIAKSAATRYHADMFALVVWSSLVPPLPLALLSFVFEGGPSVGTAVASASALAWGCVLLLAWGATLFGFASWASCCTATQPRWSPRSRCSFRCRDWRAARFSSAKGLRRCRWPASCWCSSVSPRTCSALSFARGCEAPSPAAVAGAEREAPGPAAVAPG